jgi:DNA-binding winged helix-turn-helix (wHTH) protein
MRDYDNPFVHRKAIRDAAYFCNRNVETEQACELLRHNQCLSLVGPRRIGKTSFLWHLADPQVGRKHNLAPDCTSFVLIDCARLATLAINEIYEFLSTEINQVVHGLDGGIVEPSAAGSHPGVFHRLEHTVRQVVAGERTLVLMLDDFEALAENPYVDANFFSSLRALANHHGITYVTTSTQPLYALNFRQASTLGSPFFNLFAHKLLAPFSDVEAAELLDDLAALGGGRFSPDVSAFLLSLAGPHPLFLQIAGYCAHEAGLAGGRSLAEGDRENLTHCFLAEAEASWSSAWRKLDRDDQRLMALFPVAWRSNPRGVTRLEALGLIVRRHPAPRVLSDGLREFVARQHVHGLLQVSPITLDSAERIALLRGQVLNISRTEFDILERLVAHAGRILSHEALATQVWRDQPEPDNERLRASVKKLRQALGEDRDLIENVRGIGYRFVADGCDIELPDSDRRMMA